MARLVDFLEIEGAQELEVLNAQFTDPYFTDAKVVPPAGDHSGTESAGEANIGGVSQRADDADNQNHTATTDDTNTDSERLPPPLNLPPLESAPHISLPDRASKSQTATPTDRPTSTPNWVRPNAHKIAQLLATAPGASEANASSQQSFPNQVTRRRSSQGTPGQSATNNKPTSLAGAFEKSNDQKFDFLGNHIAWEKEKFNKLDQREADRFEWEKL
ncbi:hypothetical protein PCANC_07760 [Puccinia coronata f. sp. avenae]|uniref:Uncharacterized protein n=1 Tax=Puccinia coronata f. sp. avenae TaxID=200324 RepID=A0A2N5VHD4_9BASI|nr:hypothetical protein PCANC_07760 [Puccinia coronata f. sp. avenae]